MIEWLARMDPRALLIGLLALGALLAFPPLIASVDRLSRRRLAGGMLYLLLGVLLVLLGLTAGVATASLHTFRRLTHEQMAVNVSIRQLGEHQFRLTLAAPDAAPRDYQVRGDEWQIDARIVKWSRHAALWGYDPVYRLERLSGRYAEVTQERSAARSAHSLAEREPVGPLGAPAPLSRLPAVRRRVLRQHRLCADGRRRRICRQRLRLGPGGPPRKRRRAPRARRLALTHACGW